MRDMAKFIEAGGREEIEVPDGLFEAAPKLKAIMSCRGGLENIDVQAATEHNVIISNNPAH